MDYWWDVCHRYVKYHQMLTGIDGVLTDDRHAMDLLEASCIPLGRGSGYSNPIWSSVYNSHTLKWRLVWNREWENVYTFTLPGG